MSSWMVTTTYTSTGDRVGATATRLPISDGGRYPRLSARIEADGSVTTMVRMDDCKKDEALAYARERGNALLLVLTGWLSVDGEPVRFEIVGGDR